MRLTKFAPVYPEPNKTNFSRFIGKSGVYIIKLKNEIVYIGSSQSDAYKALTRHFQDWSASKQRRVLYPQKPEYRARMITTTAKQAPILEKLLIRKHKPRDNSNSIQLGIKYNISREEIKENERVLESMKKGMDRGPVPF